MFLLIITIQHVPLGPIRSRSMPVPWAVLLCCFLISNTRGNGPGSTLKAGGKCRMSSQHAGKVRVFMVLRWFSDLHQGFTRAFASLPGLTFWSFASHLKTWVLV